jgi:hypothetical protein
MADRNIKWGGMDIAYVFFLQQSLDPKMKRLASNFIEADEEYLTKEAATGKMGFVIERMQNGKCSKLYSSQSSCSSYQTLRLAFGQYSVRISVWTSTVLTEIFCLVYSIPKYF